MTCQGKWRRCDYSVKLSSNRVPIENAINQASTNVAQLNTWPHPYISPPGVSRPTAGHSPYYRPDQ